jgi:hypothetical protein
MATGAKTGEAAAGGLAAAVASGGSEYLMQLYWNQQASQHPDDYIWAENSKGVVEATPLWVALANAGFSAPAASTPAPSPGSSEAAGASANTTSGWTPTSWVTQVLTDAGLPATPNNINNMLHWLPAENGVGSWAYNNNPLNASLGTAAGDGTAPYPDLATAAEETAKMILQSNMQGIAQVLANNGNIDQFSAAVVESPWAGSRYGVAAAGAPAKYIVPGRGLDYLAGTSPGGGSVTSGGAVATSSTMTAADWQALASVQNVPGAANYLTGMANQAAVAAQSTGAVAASPTGTLADIVTSVLQPWGLDTPTIQSWVTAQITDLAAQNMSSAQIGEQIGIELQQPVGSSSDPLTTAAQQAFANLYPGMAIRAKNGLPPITVAQYQALQDSYYQSASAVGITPAMLNGIATAGGATGDAVAQLIGNDVSPSEVTARLTNGYNAAVNANPETMKLLQEYYPTVFPQGSGGQAPGTGALLAYYLDPANTVTTLQNQVTAAQIGTEGVNSQFGGIPVAQAQKLQQAGVTQSTARSTFNSLAKLTPFETTLPGTQSPNAMLTQDQLIDYGFFGANQQLLENVESNRKAPFSGGGGYAATSKGIVGAGGASTEGILGT